MSIELTKWAREQAAKLQSADDVARALLLARALQATLDGHTARALQLGAAAELLSRRVA
jgi:hypothetical protein